MSAVVHTARQNLKDEKEALEPLIVRDESSSFRNIMLAICAVGIMTMTYIQYQQYEDYQEIKKKVAYAEMMERHCKIMTAVGKPCKQ